MSLATISGAAGWTAVVVGAVVLLGWLLDIDWLKSFVPGLLTMKPNTALCFVTLGSALLLSGGGRRARRAADALAVFVVAIAGATLAQYVLGVDLGLDQVLFREPAGAVGTVTPARMSPITAVCFLLLAVSLLLARLPPLTWVASTLNAFTLILATINILDVIYQADAPTFLAGYTQMALNTAITFVVLTVGLLARRGDGGPLAILSGNRMESVLSRRLVVASVVIPIVVGWLRLQGQNAGLYDTAYGLALTTLATIALLIAVVSYSARQVAVAVGARDEAEAELRSLTTELSRSNEELQQFASVASHDLQEPLRKILAFGDRLQTQFSELLGPTGSDYVERMRKAARRMQTLINGLLDYSRIPTTPPEPVPVDLTRLVKAVAGDLESAIEDTGAELKVGRLPTLDADRVQMRQLFQNLLANALKYRHPDRPPRVEVHAELDRPTPSDEAQRRRVWRISVRDNGIGFDDKYVDRIFAPFQRLHSRAEYEGSGIGLAVCRKIVERHEGAITAHSRPGVGSTFVVTLPAREREGAAL